MLKNHKNILYSLIAIIILFFGYWYFVLSKKDTTTGNNTLVATTPTQGTQQSNQKTYDKEFVTSLQAIQYIDLDTTILTSPAYKALSFPEVPFQVDYNIPVGRRNPFLSIGDDPQSSGFTNTEVPVQETITNISTTTPATTSPTLPNPKKR
jgi:hypothetical protein